MMDVWEPNKYPYHTLDSNLCFLFIGLYIRVSIQDWHYTSILWYKSFYCLRADDKSPLTIESKTDTRTHGQIVGKLRRQRRFVSVIEPELSPLGPKASGEVSSHLLHCPPLSLPSLLIPYFLSQYSLPSTPTSSCDIRLYSFLLYLLLLLIVSFCSSSRCEESCYWRASKPSSFHFFHSILFLLHHFLSSSFPSVLFFCFFTSFTSYSISSFLSLFCSSVHLSSPVLPFLLTSLHFALLHTWKGQAVAHAKAIDVWNETKRL